MILPRFCIMFGSLRSPSLWTFYRVTVYIIMLVTCSLRLWYLIMDNACKTFPEKNRKELNKDVSIFIRVLVFCFNYLCSFLYSKAKMCFCVLFLHILSSSSLIGRCVGRPRLSVYAEAYMLVCLKVKGIYKIIRRTFTVRFVSFAWYFVVGANRELQLL